jgi:N-acetylated-alpha-linked acidic dipeptidase
LPALNIGFGGEDAGGEYHSIYDSYDHYSKFKDPGFVYGVALAKTAGRAALRMADAEVLPFDFTRLQKTIAGYVKELSGTVDQLRETTKVENELIKSNVYQLAQDPTKTEKLPVAKAAVPYLDFHGIQNALDDLDKAGKNLNDWLSKQDNKVSAKTNQSLYRAEQQLLSVQGLPRRGWFKHTIYAPGFYTGYGVKTMPGIREAIEQKNWVEAQEQMNIDAANIASLANYLQAITQ